MASALWGKFTSDVLKEVKFKYDHKGIQQELLEHMEEMYDDLQAEGMDSSAAEVMVLVHMGDAEEIGKALNEEHSPILGWIWRICWKAVWIMWLFSILWWVGPFMSTVVRNVFDQYEIRENVDVVYSVDVGEKVEVYGERIFFDEVIYYTDGILEIRGTTLDWDRQGNESALSKGNRIVIADENGNQYNVQITWNHNTPPFWAERQGFYFKSQLYVKDFPENAEKLYIGYDWQMKNHIVIDLPKGGSI